MKTVLVALAMTTAGTTIIAMPALAQDAHAHAGHDMAAHAATQAAAPAVATRLGLDTPVEQLVADAAAKAVLDANLPGITAHESYPMFKAFSLKQIAAYAPDQLSADTLAKIEAGLTAIK